MKRPFGSTQTDHVAAAELSETAPWLQHTRWAELFCNRPLDIIAASAQQPAFQRSGRYMLGQWQGFPLWSSAEIEAQLRIILQGLDLIFDRTRATLDRTPSYQASKIFGDMEKIRLLRISHSAVPNAATPGSI
ncbi:hypothetical protein FIE12Z_12378 [Fusarium flagelliforme]|uniref:Uncharacterized protein n=1 Tax=Fusarium flagelliforme TaxID=2675880 RepID=A0A395M693_9HYPO|nr:hypothetical protein FIE12Z_12378 [Fusarium flagelliforme]